MENIKKLKMKRREGDFMKKLIVGLLLAISTISLAKEEKLYVDEMPYVKEIVEINETGRFNWHSFVNDEIKYIVQGINEDLTFEIEKQILQIPKNDIIYKSYIFGKDNIKVRVLYLKALENK